MPTLAPTIEVEGIPRRMYFESQLQPTADGFQVVMAMVTAVPLPHGRYTVTVALPGATSFDEARQLALPYRREFITMYRDMGCEVVV